MNKNKILDLVKEENREMVSKVNLDNLLKCFSAMFHYKFDEILKNEKLLNNFVKYIEIWADNKKWLYEGLYNHNLTIDINFSQTKDASEWRDLLLALAEKEEYMIYSPYIKFLASHIDATTEPNNANLYREYSYDYSYGINGLFPNALLNKLASEKGLKLTTIASKYFKLPIKLVDDMGRELDSNKNNCNLSLSIDPVDILTCSVTPYNWRSCYSIEGHGGSHADGALAAMVDTSSQIAIGWKNKGKLSLAKTLELKDVKYKMFRAWFNINFDCNAIHMSSAYPYRDNEHTKSIRMAVEKVLADYTKLPNQWRARKIENCEARLERVLKYGYNEFNETVYTNTPKKEGAPDAVDNKDIYIYDTPLFLLDDCTKVVLGSCESIVNEDSFDEYCDEYSNIDYDDYYDEETDSYDDYAYYTAKDEERESLWEDFVASCEPLSKKYGITQPGDYYYFCGDSMGECSTTWISKQTLEFIEK